MTGAAREWRGWMCLEDDTPMLFPSQGDAREVCVVVTPAGLADARAEAADALRAWQEWWEHEDRGPAYPDGIGRDGPGGETVWKEWYSESLRLCDAANTRACAALDALAREEGK